MGNSDHARQRENQRRMMARRLAMQALYQWSMTQQPPRQICHQFEDDIDYPKADEDYFSTLVQSVIDSHETLDSYIAPYVARGIETLDPVARAILRIAAWELAHEPAVPFRVVINEAIALAKRFGAEDSWKMVNGVTDKMAKELRPLEKQASRNP